MKGLKLLRYGFTAVLALALSFSATAFAPEAQALSCTVPATVYVDAVSGINRASDSTYGCWGRDATHAFETVQAAVTEMNSRSGGSSAPTIVYKSDSGTESVNNTGVRSYTIKPWTGYATITGKFEIKGKNITVKSFTFTGGGILIQSTSTGMKVTSNTFKTGSTFEIKGASTVTVQSNTFDKTYAYVHDNTGAVTITTNTFKNGAPNVTINYGTYTTNYGNWYAFVEKQTGAFSFTSNTVSGGQTLIARTSSNVSITSNTTAGTGSTGNIAFYLYNTNASSVKGNTITGVGRGVKIYGTASKPTVTTVEDNTITLANNTTSQSNGIDVVYATVGTINRNTISTADIGINLDQATLTTADANIVTGSTTGIFVYYSTVDTLSNNALSGASGKGIYVVYATALKTIRNNSFGDGLAGIVMESKYGDFSNWEVGELSTASSSMSSDTDIYSNTFQGTGLAIGLSSTNVGEVYSNTATSVGDGIIAYASLFNEIRNNNMSHSAAATGEGIMLHGSMSKLLSNNVLNDFPTGIKLMKLAYVQDVFDSNLVEGGTYGLYADEVSNIMVAVTNGLFADQVNGVYVAAGNGFPVLSSTFYGQSTAAVYLNALLISPMTVVDNVFSDFALDGAVKTDSLTNFALLDYNLYDSAALGGTVLMDTSTGAGYTLTDLQSAGLEASAYEEAGTALVNPVGGDFSLNAISLGVNSGNNTYSPATDFSGNYRPYCNVSDRGAFETASNSTGAAATDADGDGLCDFQESAWGSSDSSADSDGDDLNDLEEIYTYGTDVMIADTDGDTFTDGEEVDFGTDPLDASDYPNDGDHDGMDDDWETGYGLDPTDAGDAAEDLDGDGLTNLEEYEAGYDPSDSDMDDDGLLDGEEGTYGTDLYDSDSDDDGYLDGDEVDAGYDPLDASEHPTDFDLDGIDDSVDTDDDNDGVEDGSDAFPYDSTEWDDSDSDGTGDNADTDDDNDGVADGSDAFPYDSTEWDDSDSDGTGDNADTDDDNDGVADGSDAFPYDSTESEDSDGDGTGDNADTDDDNDGYTDTVETGYGTDPYDATDYPTDVDGDGLDDATVDTDDDNDGVLDVDDAFPYDSTESEDSDGDGTGDNADTDDDNDGVADGSDAFPYDSTESEDSDGDGTGDNADTDDDNDGVADGSDAFPYDSTESEDSDGDGTGDNADTDDDNDGYTDTVETNYGTDPYDATDYPIDFDLDGTDDSVDTDDDNDGVADSSDAFPYDSTESEDSDGDGTGNNADTDDDNDGVVDASDAFPEDSTESVDTDGDGTGNNADTDDDNDGVADASDAFPEDSTESVDTDGDGTGNNTDTDDDNDGYSDSAEVAAGSDPLDSADDPTMYVDTDGDGLLDTEEATYGTDASDTDSDDDLFRDDYEISEGTNPLDSGDMPSLTMSFVGHQAINGYGDTTSFYSTLVYYSSGYQDWNVTYGEVSYVEMYYYRYGALGVSWNEEEYLGSVNVEYCGADLGAFNPSGYTCSAITEYSSSSSPDSEVTHVSSSSQLERWSDLSGTYTFDEWEWYRPIVTSSSSTAYYNAFEITLAP